MKKKNHQYSAKLRVDVKHQHIDSEVNLEYCNKDRSRALKFYVHENLEIEDIQCQGLKSYKVGEKVEDWCPFILESKLVELFFDDSIMNTEVLQLKFKYHGHINVVSKYGMNRLTPEWIELGLYTPWFPLHESMDKALFSIEIDITEGYEVINAVKQKGKYFLQQPIPINDATIIASKDFESGKSKVEDIDVDVFIIRKEDKEQLTEILDYTKKMLRVFKVFGSINSIGLSIFIAPRSNGGGYCRPGLIVLTPNDQKQDVIGYFKYIAHEIAHLWWLKADVSTWEDWLNESFAEYSALLAVREFFGEEEFSKFIDAYKSKVKGLPPIKGLKRGDPKAWEVLYIKGPLVLYELEKSMGREKFIEFLKKVHMNNIQQTDKFLENLQQFSNRKTKEAVEEALGK